MKENTVHSLVVARTLLERSAPLCSSEDRYLASAGLIILQDALESVIYALLIELGVDEEKSIEKKGFDELIGELKGCGVSVPKSGTLKALNKQRVLAKHYAQLAEPAMVRSYQDAAISAIESLTTSVLGRSIRDLFISDLLADSESKEHLQAAERHIGRREYLEALLSIRKAIYVEFEEDYNIAGWRDHDGSKQDGLLASFARGGWKAPSWKRNSEWISKYVKVPTDYVQVDYQALRLDALEFGIHTAELQNLQHLTPAVFRYSRGDEWASTYDAAFASSNASESNARYCLDRAVWVVLRKQEHARVRRAPSRDVPFDPPPVYVGRVLYEKPSTNSLTLHVVSEGFQYTVRRVVSGFDPRERFYELSAASEDFIGDSLPHFPKHFYKGYLQIVEDES